MDCAPENTREPRTGASARAFRVAVLNQSYATAESFTLRGKVLPKVVENNCTEPCLVQDLQACSHSWAKLSTLVIPTPKGGGICGTTTLLPNRFCDAVNEEAGVPARQTSKTPASPPACKSVH
ncbi:MAG: hypothetical protein DMG83_07515 [Acidobacteria bacterium]|nr:MAG: hypothetical protein DMG83_07515 [Acidobacteriota bacterium]